MPSTHILVRKYQNAGHFQRNLHPRNNKKVFHSVLFFGFFGWNLGDVNLDKIAIFCCLNCIFECINGFSMLKNPWAL
jgi:hypothetical protein